MDELTIGQVAQYAGVRTSAIRYYESVGLLPRPKRVNGRRRYDPGVLKRLGLIQLVRQAGFGIRDLQLLFNGSAIDAPASSMWKSLAVEKIAEMDALIERTQAAKAWLAEALQRDCQGAEECVTITFDETGNSPTITFSCEKMVSFQLAQSHPERVCTGPPGWSSYPLHADRNLACAGRLRATCGRVTFGPCEFLRLEILIGGRQGSAQDPDQFAWSDPFHD